MSALTALRQIRLTRRTSLAHDWSCLLQKFEFKNTYYGNTLVIDKDVKFVGEGDPIDPIKLAQCILSINILEKQNAL